jgi:hypothetical protein
MRSKNAAVKARNGIEVKQGIVERFEESCAAAERSAKECGGGEWDFAGVRTGLVLAVGAALVGAAIARN